MQELAAIRGLLHTGRTGENGAIDRVAEVALEVLGLSD
jgi:hypothetical protein